MRAEAILPQGSRSPRRSSPHDLIRDARARHNDLAFTCERAGVNSVECTTVARVCQVQRLVRPSATRKAKTHGKPRCFAPATSFHAHRAGAWRSSGRIDRDLVAQHCDAEDRRKRVAIDPRNLSRSHCLTRAHPRAPCPRAHNRGASNS
jgi:hypothetical protein